MLSEEHNILIEKFFRGELSAAELQTFKDLLQSNADFRAGVELHRTVVAGISAYGKGLLKAELAGVHKEVKADIKDYQPPGNGGSWFGKAFKLFMLGAVVGAGAYAYINREHLKPYADKVLKTVVKMDTTVVKKPDPGERHTYIRDTVWHVIHTTKVRKGDTVIVTSEEDWRDKVDVKGKTTIKSDTTVFFDKKEAPERQ